MADGRTQNIENLQVGDRIYGTERDGNYRRYVSTEVLAHWSTIKRAYRITLGDGTVLVASADHRFLSDRGWKHVIGAEQGPLQRPFLTPNNKLIGTGQFVEGPKDSRDYRLGYLTGMIRGDGHVGSYSYPRAGRTRFDVHRFRLALRDEEALVRAQSYLKKEGVPTKEFIFTPATENHYKISAIRTSTRDGVQRIRNLKAWPSDPSLEWQQGFVAGLFDAEGSCSNGVLRICNCDVDLMNRLAACLRTFEFSYRFETRSGTNAPVVILRILGGLRERLRFFHAFDPAITRKRTIEGVALKSDAPLRVVKIEDLGFDLPMYDITTGTGDFIANGVVSHNCYAALYAHVHGHECRQGLRDKDRRQGERCAGSSQGTPGEEVEGRAHRYGHRHRPLSASGRQVQVDAGDHRRAQRGSESVLHTYEGHVDPAGPRPLTGSGRVHRRLDGLLDSGPSTRTRGARASRGHLTRVNGWTRFASSTMQGIPCGVMIAAILPGITDGVDQLKEVVHAAVDSGATFVTPIMLHLRPKVKEVYMDWLTETYPHLVDRYEAMYGRSAYASKDLQKDLSSTVHNLVDEAPKPRNRPRRVWRNTRREQEKKAPDNEQLSLI